MMAIINCWKISDNPVKFLYIKSYFDPIHKIIYFGKYKHFKIGDHYRVKNYNGYVSEVEIVDILEDGFVDVRVYHKMLWHDGKKFYAKGKQTFVMTASGFNGEDLFIDLQERGSKFHKIKKLHKKYKIIRTYWKNW